MLGNAYSHIRELGQVLLLHFASGSLLMHLEEQQTMALVLQALTPHGDPDGGSGPWLPSRAAAIWGMSSG